MLKVPEPLAAGRLRLVWVPREDRVGHRIEVLSAHGTVPVLETIEDAISASPRWPGSAHPSPPLSEWHCEVRPAGVRVALGVGRAGSCHWSAAFEYAGFGSRATEAGTTGRTSRLSFDIACRASRGPVFYGSHYRPLGECRSVDAGHVELPGGAILSCDAAVTRLEFDRAAGTIGILPLQAATDAWPQTVEWRYSIAC
jgi:hypothetical protein